MEGMRGMTQEAVLTCEAAYLLLCLMKTRDGAALTCNGITVPVPQPAIRFAKLSLLRLVCWRPHANENYPYLGDARQSDDKAPETSRHTARHFEKFENETALWPLNTQPPAEEIPPLVLESVCIQGGHGLHMSPLGQVVVCHRAIGIEKQQ